jgi:CubicO group peptidase (beta-lactamase class C family)
MRTHLWMLLAVITIVSHAGVGCANEIDIYIKDQLKKQHLPGLSFAVVRAGRIVKSGGYGQANLEWNLRATPDTAYQLASVTKQFTAAAILLLAADGKLRLSDNVTQYFESLPRGWSGITIRHLLTMTSGVADYLEHIPESQWQHDFTRERLIEIIGSLPVEFQPGERFSYSNSNYLLLAMIIREVTQQSYDVFLEERVFKPLGMTATRCDTPYEVIPNRAALYERRSNTWVNARFLSPSLWNNGDGGLISTVLDLAKWDQALDRGSILSASAREVMWAPMKLNNGHTSSYGCGWNIGERRGHRWVAHSGGRPGHSAHIIRFLDDHLTVIVLTNGPGDAAGMALHIAGLYLPGLTLSSFKPGRDPEPALTRSLKQCLLDLAEKGDSVLVVPQFREECAKSKSRIADIRRNLENLKAFDYIGREDVKTGDWLPGVTRLCSYRVTNDQGTRFYTFELTRDNRVVWCHSTND